MSPRRIDDILNHLEAAERQFPGSEFLAPVLRGGRVQVRIAAVVCSIRVRPRDFVGWGVFRAASHTEADLVRTARLAERQQYLELFPLVRLILCRTDGPHWLALPAHRGDTRLRIQGLVPVHLVEDAQAFETVESRFDGSRFWFDRIDGRRDPFNAATLRLALNDMREPEAIDVAGLTPEERAAYAFAYAEKLEESRDRVEVRLRAALAHAGAEFLSYLERGDGYRIEYTVDGSRHISVVAKDDLSVQVAGICLAGQDAKFDLESLVGVLREAEGGWVPRVGIDNAGIDEDLYWDVHPPEDA